MLRIPGVKQQLIYQKICDATLRKQSWYHIDPTKRSNLLLYSHMKIKVKNHNSMDLGKQTFGNSDAF
jgi:hypothetical protein